MKNKRAPLITGLIAIIFAFACIQSFAAFYGDANRDEKVNSSDARKILRIAAKLDAISENDPVFDICDIDRNGKINSTDARKVLRMAAKLEDLIEIPGDTPTTDEPTSAVTTTAELTTAESTTAAPITAEPTTAVTTTAEPITAEPTTAVTTTAEPTTGESTTVEPTTAEQTTAVTTTAEPTTAESSTAAPTTAEPTTAEPTTAEPTTAEPTTAEPTTAEPTTAEPTTAPAEQPFTDYKVTPAEWANVEWEKYENVYFTLTIPKGWQVEWQGNAQQLYWRVTNPDGDIGLSNLDHRYAAKDIRYMQMGGSDMYLAEGTVREFFETVYSNSTEYFTVKNSTVPDNKEQLQAIRPYTPIRDYQSMYAVFKENGREGEGIYSAVVMESRDVWAGGMNYGMWEINCIFTEWTPLGALVNWQPVLSTVAQSFQYTDYYIQEWRSVLGTNASPEGQTNIGDSVLEAFEERSTADTILQEKRSDMIGEYERVVDNESGDIYRAYNGFLDDIGSEQTRYTPITDDQYAEGFVGWIDKP